MKNFIQWTVPFLITVALLSGCTKDNSATSLPINNTAELPQNVEFYLSPAKEFYLPYQRVTLTLRVKNKGTFEKDLHIDPKKISHITLTPLSKSNSQYTYQVNWKQIHMNSHGYEGRTTKIKWYLPNNWAGIIPQTPQQNRVQFTISSPVGYWETDEFTINIHVPKEEVIPYNDLIESGCYKFLEHEYASRAYNKNWSTYPNCPIKKLPYNNLREFIQNYPYSTFTKEIMNNLQNTVRILKNKHTEYDAEDMEQVEQLLQLKS